MSAFGTWKDQYLRRTLCFLILVCLAALPLRAQDPTAQTAVNNIESLGVIPATQPLAGLGFNIDTTNEWEFVLAASAGTTHVRFQCSWAETEAQTAPPMNASGGYALSPNCTKALAFSKKYGMHPTLIAAFGAPFHQILKVSVPDGAPAGSTKLSVQFSAGIGGDTLASVAAFYDAIISSNGNQLSSRNSYAGDLITSVNQTDDTHATLTLASALTSALPADGTTTYTINEYLFPPAATSSSLDPSVTAYANYSLFLAQSIAAAGLAGEVEIWNEPPWSPDPWDARQNFYDVFPGPGIPGPIAGNMPNWGFAAALSKKSYAVPGVPYVWAGTNKSADNSLLAAGMLLNTRSLFAQPATNVKTESIHPYGNNPEDDIWSETCVKNSILPNPLKPLYFTRCNLDSNSTSNVVELEQLNLIAKSLNANGGIGHSITETGFSLSDGDLAHEARFVMRQFLAYQAVGVTPVEFYRLYDTSPDDLTFTNLSTNAPLPAFTAISGLMSDLAAIKEAPVTPANSSNLPSIVSYGGFFPLDTVSIVGARPGDTSNSEVFAVWQRSHVTGGAKWATSASPAAMPVTIAIPKGSTAVSVVNLDTRAAVAFTANSQQITFAVSDDPIEVLVEPTPPTTPAVTSISIVPATASVIAGATLSFSCTTTLSDGTTSACTSPVYTSSNPSIASVSNNAATGLLPGSATITVLAAGSTSSASAVLTVTAPPTTVTSISIAPATASVVEGAVLSFSCTATLSNGTTSACSSPVYTSSNPSIASVSSNAVTGVLPGSATITVSAAGASPASALLTVTAPPPTVTSVSIAPATASVVEGAVLNFSCTAMLSNGTTSACTSPVYTSSNPSIASVSNNAVTGVLPGSATITVSATGATQSSALVTVLAPPTTITSISIAPGAASVVEGGVLSFNCTATLSNGTTSSCSSPVYTSSNPNVASVSSNAVTGVLPGTATITASVEGGPPPASALLTVTAPATTVTSISITPATASVVEGAVLNFSCTATLSNGTTSACTSPVYTSSNPLVASVSSNAVTGLVPGSATITVSATGATQASALLTVTAPATTVTSISIAPATASVVEGSVVNFTCTAALSNGTTSACTSPVYTASNPSIASVSNNAATGLLPGSATITVSAAGASPASALLTVTAPPTTVTSISIAPATASVVEGAVLNFSCTATLSNGTTSACTSPVYASSNPLVAAVSSSAVTGVLPGTATITASVAGGPPPASALLTVTAPAAISVTLTVSPTVGDTYGSPVVLTETSPALGGTCPTSSVVFSSAGLPLGVANFVASPISAPTYCIGTVTTTALPVGTDQIAAMSSAEGSFGPISSTATVTVAAIPGTGDTLSVGPTSSTVGSPVTIVFKLASVAGAALPATGSVIFASKGTTLGTGALKTTGSGINAVTTATFLTSSLAVGTDTVTGVYGGDQNYGPASPTAIETVTATPKASASITLSSLTHTYSGAAQGAAVATVPAGVTYQVAYNGSSNVPIEAGSYSVIATITDPLYTAQPATGTLTISKEQSKLSWTPYTTVSSPDVPIGSNVLNAQCSVPGEITYTAQPSDSETITVSATSFLSVGHYTLTGACAPSDATNHASSSSSVSFSVLRDSVFVANSSGELASFFDNGVPQGQNSTGGGIGVAVDPSGNVWSINSSGDSVSRFDKTGTMLSVSTGGGLSSPKALAADASGRVWVVNGTGTISSLRTDGSPASVTAYSNPELKSPISVSVDFKGSVWVANKSSDSVTEVIGVAAPTVTPMVSAETGLQP